MDTFCEQVVKRESGVKQKLISALLISFFAVIELLFILIYSVIADPTVQIFFLMLTFMVAVVAVTVLIIALPRINKVEFDYSVMGNIFYVDKVINKKSRKKFVKMEISSIEDMGKIEGDNIPSDRYARTRDCSNGKMEDSYYCVYRESGKGKCLLIFSPKQKIIDGMRPAMTREMVVKLFYNKK